MKNLNEKPWGGHTKRLLLITLYAEVKRCLLLGRKAMTNLDSILKSRDITLVTKVCLAKAMVFPVVMYGCKSGVGEDSRESFGLQGDPTSQS